VFNPLTSVISEMSALRASGAYSVGTSKNTRGADSKVTPKTFAARLRHDGAHGDELRIIVRDTLSDTLGELPAVATLSYTGDAANGDFLGFATRIEELFGSSATPLLNVIATTYEAARAKSKVP